jgi:hypothetical protein
VNELVVGIMGAGMMAQGFDKPGDPHVLSLAHAVSVSPGLRLGGFFDRNVERAQAAERKWACPASPRERSDWLSRPWDIVCIATPDERHGDDLCDVLQHKPKAILIEKPLATDADQGAQLLRKASGLGIPLLVDFPRRFHSGVGVVSGLIAEGRLGSPSAATFVYSGEASHSAVHMLDLFHTWWGNGWNVENVGHRGNATLVEFVRSDERFVGAFVPMPADAYYVWEMTVFCARGKIELSNSPETLEISLLAPHPLYTSFKVLTPLHSFDMENEPLLVRAFEHLAAVAMSAARGAAQLVRETGSQEFSGRVLALLGER